MVRAAGARSPTPTSSRPRSPPRSACSAPQRPPIERVKEHLRDRHALLVLDNFEQVVAGAPVVADLLRVGAEADGHRVEPRAAPISGEQEFPVPPLSLPPAGAAGRRRRSWSPRRSGCSSSARWRVRPDFMLTTANGAAVAEVVRRLDGLPLAIELAAARIRLLSPAAMAQRLGDRLDLGSGGGRDLPERQRTLRGAIDWSHDLLDPEDRRLFARLGGVRGRRADRDWRTRCAAIPGDERAARRLRRARAPGRAEPRSRSARMPTATRGSRCSRRSASTPSRSSTSAARRPRCATGTPSAFLAFATATGERGGRPARRPRRRRHASARPVRGRARQPPDGPRTPDRDRRHASGRPRSPSRCGASGTSAATSIEGRARVEPRPGDARPGRTSRRRRGCGRSRRPAGSPTGAPTRSPPGALRSRRSRWRAAGRRRRARQCAVQPFSSRVGPTPDRRRVDRRSCATRTAAARRGARHLDPAGRRGGHGQGHVGPLRAARLPRRLRGGRSVGDRGAGDLRAPRRSVLDQLVEVHARLRAGPEPRRRARPPISARRCRSSRSLTTSRASPSCWRACRPSC